MSTSQRLHLIDAVRGSAIALMVIYHFCYDLDYFKFAQFDFYYDSFWIYFRAFIVGIFLLVVGISLIIATQKGIVWKQVSKRFFMILVPALLITLVSYFMFPGRTIVFGILHFIAFASLVGLIFYRLYWSNLMLGIAIITSGIFLKFKFFDNEWLQWIGLVTQKPPTEDYVPVIPWLGVVLTGMFLGKVILSQPEIIRLAHVVPAYSIFNWLTFAGRHSLIIYLIHQPVLMAILYLVVTVF